tara:strand:- start:200 stop:1153 length:954 start_codon:yes stop_codon:yes gene_type:complete
MAVYTKINLREIKYIEKNYNIGKITNFSGIKKGIENSNYIIQTKNRKFILTIFEKRVQKKDLPFFMNLMFGLSKLKIKCPEPIKNKSGKYLLKIKNKSACLVSFLKGKDKKQLNYNDCYIVGKNIAKLHIASKKLNLFRKNSLSISSWNSLFNKIGKNYKNYRELMKTELKYLKKNWPKNLPFGIIHADIFIDNIFFFKKKFYGFIDFYFSASEYLAYELAICINALCFDKRNNVFKLNKKKSSKLIRGYQSVKKLSKSEKENLNVLCRGSALRYLLTRSYDYVNTPKSALIKIKDPKEYIQKLNYHRNLNSFKDYS